MLQPQPCLAGSSAQRTWVVGCARACKQGQDKLSSVHKRNNLELHCLRALSGAYSLERCDEELHAIHHHRCAAVRDAAVPLHLQLLIGRIAMLIQVFHRRLNR